MISIIIPAFNCSLALNLCLQSIFKQNLENKEYEVIVVDDGSTDNTQETAQNFPVKLISQRHQGAAAARNQGAQEAKGSLLLFIDADCTVDNNWISKHKTSYQNPTDIGVLGGAITISASPHSIFEIFDHYSTKMYQQHPKRKSSSDNEYLNSTNLSCLKERFFEVSGFDESLPTGEDVDFCHKMSKAGYNIYFRNDIVVYHSGRNSLKNFLLHHYQWGKHAPKLRRQNKSLRFHWLFPRNIILAILYFLPISLGYAMLITKGWLPYIGFKALLFLPSNLISKAAYACGVLKGTLELNQKNNK